MRELSFPIPAFWWVWTVDGCFSLVGADCCCLLVCIDCGLSLHSVALVAPVNQTACLTYAVTQINFLEALRDMPLPGPPDSPLSAALVVARWQCFSHSYLILHAD